VAIDSAAIRSIQADHRAPAVRALDLDLAWRRGRGVDRNPRWTFDEMVVHVRHLRGVDVSRDLNSSSRAR